MEKQMLNVLNKTYDNLILRRTTVPLFMSNPGMGKSTIIKNFAKSKNVKMVKITLSTRMPNEVAGMVI
jgi:guanylate kinase